MAKILRNWTKLNNDERKTFGQGVVDKLASNPVLPATNADYVAYTAAFTALDAKSDQITDLEEQLTTARLARAPLVDTWLELTEQLAKTVDAAAKGDAAKISSTGFDPSEGSTQGPQEVTQVVNFTVTAGDNDGELDYQHDRVRGARTYELQTTATNPNDAAGWVNQPATTRSSGTLKNLTSGSRQWVRARAVGPLGPGPWSDPATKVVP